MRELSNLVGTLENARSRPEDIEVVRDPVLSDRYFKDSGGACWRENNSSEWNFKLANNAISLWRRPVDAHINAARLPRARFFVSLATLLDAGLHILPMVLLCLEVLLLRNKRLQHSTRRQENGQFVLSNIHSTTVPCMNSWPNRKMPAFRNRLCAVSLRRCAK